MLPMQEMLYNWSCVELSLIAEKEAMDEAQKQSKNNMATGPSIDFDTWSNEVSKENAKNIKEKRFGIKR